MDWLGIDIGGANIKAATTRGQALSVPFALWKEPENLAGELSKIVARFAGDENRLAVTMTGELADCFRTKAEGVRFIVAAVEKAAGSRPVRFYTTHGLFVDANAARNVYLRVAAANWHALASFSTRFLTQAREVQPLLLPSVSEETGNRSAVLLDVGSTTTDIVPIRSDVVAVGGNATKEIAWHPLPVGEGRGEGIAEEIGQPLKIDVDSEKPLTLTLSQREREQECDLPSRMVPRRNFAGGLTDTDRLVASELVYAGVVRTPLCAMIQHVNYRGRNCGIARELFATMLDVYLMLDEISESDDTSQTADGRAANKACAIDRLARMICADSEIFNARDAIDFSQQAREAQVKLVGHAVLAVAEQMPFPRHVVISGQGEFLAREIAQRFLPDAEIISLGAQIGQQLSQVAPAYAVAVLAAESIKG